MAKRTEGRNGEQMIDGGADIIELSEVRARKDANATIYERVEDFLYLNKESGVYFVRKTFVREGIPPLFKSTRLKQKGRAKSEAERMIQQWRNRHLGVDDSKTLKTALHTESGPRIKDICEKILREKTPLLRRNTRKQHKLYFQYIIRHCGHFEINNYTVRMFEDWIDAEFCSGRRRSYINFAKHMNILWRYAYNEKLVTHLLKFPNPDRRIRSAVENKARSKLTKVELEILELTSSRLYTSDELSRIWAVSDEDLRDQLSLAGNYMRKMEKLALRWSQVDLITGKVTLGKEDVKTGSKTGKGRSFFLAPSTLERLRRRRERQTVSSPYVFPSPMDSQRHVVVNCTAWKVAKRKAGITGKARWHDLRHTALTFALLGDPSLPEEQQAQQRRDPVLVSEYAGVSIATIQKVYLHSQAEHTRSAAGAIDFGSFSTKKF